MGLKNIVQKAASAAFKATGEFACVATYRRRINIDTTTEYDSNAWQEYSVKGFVSKRNDDWIYAIAGDYNALSSKRILTILGTDIPFTPDVLDKMILQGFDCRIDSVSQDTAGIVWKIEFTQLRSVMKRD